MKAIILAGGSGERFWPFSTQDRPKQFLDLFGKGPLLRMTCDRLMERLGPDDIFVVTSKEHCGMSRNILPELPPGNIIGEPVRRNTAPACALGAVVAGTDELQLVVPADHMIPDNGLFWESVGKAVHAHERLGGLMTFGIRPAGPETGFGYIQAGEYAMDGIRKVIRFTEKPDIDRARRFVSSGDHFWNSGMFLWKGSDLLDEMREHERKIWEAIEGLEGTGPRELEAAYRDIHSISVDHAIMERSSCVLMVEASFRWSDLGSWDSIRDISGDTIGGGNLLLEMSDRTYVRSTTGRPIAIIGAEDMIVVDTDEGLLVCRAGHSQDVRKAAKRFSHRI